VRRRLWTATTNGPLVHPPGDLWVWRSMAERCRQRKLLTHSADLTGNSTSSHLVASRRNERRELQIWPCIFVHTCKWLFTCRKILRHGASEYISPCRNACYGFLSPLEIHRFDRIWTREPWN
jgi:hypothetical protein